GSSPVIRSRPHPPSGPPGGRLHEDATAVWPSGSGKGLQNPVPRFNSGHRLHPFAYDRGSRARSSAGERFPDTEEVTGSNPVAPTILPLSSSFVKQSGPLTDGIGGDAGASGRRALPCLTKAFSSRARKHVAATRLA